MASRGRASGRGAFARFGDSTSPKPDPNSGPGPRALLNVFFDVDHTLLFARPGGNVLRPRAGEAMERLKAAGHNVYVWSAGGQSYVEQVVETHRLRQWVDGCFDKDSRVRPRPDFIIDDDWYLVEKYGGHLVSQYKGVDEGDRELLDAVDRLVDRGCL